MFNIRLADEVHVDGSRVLGDSIGQFDGRLLADHRTWEGQYKAWTSSESIVGVQNMPVTFTKD
jgi:hypothetical protein